MADRWPRNTWPRHEPVLCCATCGRLTNSVTDQIRHVLEHGRTTISEAERTPLDREERTQLGIPTFGVH